MILKIFIFFKLDLFQEKKKLVGKIETFMEIKVVYETREYPNNKNDEMFSGFHSILKDS